MGVTNICGEQMIDVAVKACTWILRLVLETVAISVYILFVIRSIVVIFAAAMLVAVCFVI